MTTDSKTPEMLTTQPSRNEESESFPSLDGLEGVSIRFSLATEQAEIRSPKKKDTTLKAKTEDKGESSNKARPQPALDHQKELVKLLHGLSSRRSHWQVFADFCEIGAITFSNAVDLAQREKREERYMQIIKGYSREELEKLSHGLAHLTMELEDGFSDVLGRTYHDL